jgi:hypothetical protein
MNKNILKLHCCVLQAGFNKPLLPPKSEDVDILSHQQEQADLEKMKMFVQLRQDLERVSMMMCVQAFCKNCLNIFS